MEFEILLGLLDGKNVVTIAVTLVVYLLISNKIKVVSNSVTHVDKAVNGRTDGELTLSQEVSVIRRELREFKTESIKILKDFNQLRKEGYLVAAELKGDVEHTNNNVKQASKATAQLVREIKREVEHIRQEVDLHREVDEKAFEQIRDDIHKIANK